uniref:Uncharacterized protein n=1 Tax=Oryza nivara TaxID=4536 RepID=A0A0E0HBX3_ORYNI
MGKKKQRGERERERAVGPSKPNLLWSVVTPTGTSPPFPSFLPIVTKFRQIAGGLLRRPPTGTAQPRAPATAARLLPPSESPIPQPLPQRKAL